MSKDTLSNLEALRSAMRAVRVSAIIIPGTDAHQSEYVSEHWKMRDWVTGFTGSNGTAVVTLDEAGLWTDSRYYLQAESQLQDSGVELHKEDVPGELSINDWLASVLDENSIIAIDGTLFSLNKANELDAFCGMHGFRLATDFNPFDKIWSDRPARPQGMVFVHEDEFAGESVGGKLSRTIEAVEATGAESMFISSLDEIAWLFNIRCSDVEYTPVTISYAYVSEDKKILFVDEAKINSTVKSHLKDNDVDVKPYDGVLKFLKGLPKMETILIDPNVISDTMAHAMECDKVYAKSPVAGFKAEKNDVQLAGVRQAMERDGAALVKLFMWIENNTTSGTINELDVWDKGKEYRAMHEYYRGDSFDMKCGYAEHGAIVHYSVSPESASVIRNRGILLIDSGAQYVDGTTDITRTISLGSPTAQQINDYTLVLKGHIAIATQIFPTDTRGSQLDVLARQFLWKNGLAYFHGTGHGIGHFLGVHEGPQNIRMNENSTTLKPGMIISNEPGVYRTGEYGIRTENLVLVVPAFETADFGAFLKFETLTLFPYDSKLIDVSMLSNEELEWINAYHETVYSRLMPYLDADQKGWLAEKTKKLNR